MNTNPHLVGGHPQRVPAILERWSRRAFWIVAIAMFAVTLGLSVLSLWALLGLVVAVPFTVMGLRDIAQSGHAVRRNFPVLGRARYLLEGLRPELRQYFVESDIEENPISREKRSIVYARAKNQLDTLPFGTQQDVYGMGYEWLNHSLAAQPPRTGEIRIRIGEGSAAHPYDASILNISAMSYGSLSSNAIEALNKGAQLGGFFHNTGEGGVSRYHRAHGGDLVWQIGTGYFGCRTLDGRFCPENYAKSACLDSVKMIELKLSQGAKPGHGGILPARKVTSEIAELRGVPLGQDVISPPSHTEFSTPIEMMEFIGRLRDLSGGKPVGFKLCVGQRREFLSLCKAMRETGISPDFISVDGAEGGTGAAPLEFSNSVGVPLQDGLNFVHNALLGAGLRDRVRVMAAGKISTGFHILRALALGADLVSSARAMMFAVGCIQAIKCNTNHCPVGVATQDPKLVRGLDVEDKASRVFNYHEATVESVYDLLAAAGLGSPFDVGPEHIFRRINEVDTRSYAEIYPQLDADAFLDGVAPERLQQLWDRAPVDRFCEVAVDLGARDRSQG